MAIFFPVVVASSCSAQQPMSQQSQHTDRQYRPHYPVRLGITTFPLLDRPTEPVAESLAPGIGLVNPAYAFIRKVLRRGGAPQQATDPAVDRKSTRLNSSHMS